MIQNREVKNLRSQLVRNANQKKLKAKNHQTIGALNNKKDTCKV